MTTTLARIPRVVLSNKPIKIVFKDDDDHRQGILHIFERSITWFPPNSQEGKTINVKDFDAFFNEFGKGRRTR